MRGLVSAVSACLALGALGLIVAHSCESPLDSLDATVDAEASAVSPAPAPLARPAEPARVVLVATDAVLADVEVWVVDDVAQPVAGVMVSAYDDIRRDAAPVHVKTTAIGSARLSLAPGRYVVSANQAAPLAGWDTRHTVVDVPCAQDAVRITLPRRAARLVVDVRDDLDHAAADLTVLLDNRPVGATDALGRVQLPSLAPGPHRIQLASGQHGRWHVPRDLAQQVELWNGQEVRAVFQVGRSGSLAVHLRGPSDAAESLWIDVTGEHPVALAPMTRAIGVNATLQLPDLAPGEYVVRMRCPPDSSLFSANLQARARVLAGARSDVTFELLRGEHTVEGAVRDPAGQPVAGVTVSVMVRAGADWREHVAKSTATDARGAFSVRGLPRGEKRVLVLADRRPDWARYRTADGPWLWLAADACRADIQLQPATRLSGRVSAPGLQWRGSRVELRGGGLPYDLSAELDLDADGYLAFSISGVPAGQFELVLRDAMAKVIARRVAVVTTSAPATLDWVVNS